MHGLFLHVLTCAFFLLLLTLKNNIDEQIYSWGNVTAYIYKHVKNLHNVYNYSIIMTFTDERERERERERELRSSPAEV